MSKHDCYESVLEFLVRVRMGLEPFNVREVSVCHGVPTLTVEPFQRFGHAWIEIGDFIVIDVAGGTTHLHVLQDYYRIGKINPDEVTRYTSSEAGRLVNLHNHGGPWQDYPEDVLFR